MAVPVHRINIRAFVSDFSDFADAKISDIALCVGELEAEICEIDQGRPSRGETQAFLRDQALKYPQYLRTFQRAVQFLNKTKQKLKSFEKIQEAIDLLNVNAATWTGRTDFPRSILSGFKMTFGKMDEITRRSHEIAISFFLFFKKYCQTLDQAIHRFNQTDPNLSFCSRWFGFLIPYELPQMFSKQVKHPTDPWSQFCLADFPHLARILKVEDFVEGPREEPTYPSPIRRGILRIVQAFKNNIRVSELALARAIRL